MPFGRVRKLPSDKLDHTLAQILQTPSPTRSRLGRHQYLTPSEHNPAGKIELALSVVLQAEPVFDRICKAQKRRRPFTRLDILAKEALSEGLITQEEAELLIEAEQHRLDTINVDEFAPEALKASTTQKELEATF
jgi:acyl-CoA dehydrogenase